MTVLRLSAATSLQFDAIRADFDRLARALSGSGTTTDALAEADKRLGALRQPLAVLRVAVRGEIAKAEARERQDRPADQKVPAMPSCGAGGLQAGRGGL